MFAHFLFSYQHTDFLSLILSYFGIAFLLILYSAGVLYHCEYSLKNLLGGKNDSPSIRVLPSFVR